MKLQRTEKVLTEQDAIELIKAVTGRDWFTIDFHDYRESEPLGEYYFTFHGESRDWSGILYPDGFELHTKYRTDHIAFTNKALELGYYKIDA